MLSTCVNGRQRFDDACLATQASRGSRQVFTNVPYSSFLFFSGSNVESYLMCRMASTAGVAS